MYKEQILAALAAKFLGVSDAILNRIADKLAKTVTREEDVATSVEGVTLQNVIESYGDSRATEAQQTAVTNYEKKHGLKDGQKATGGEPKPNEPINTQPAEPQSEIEKAIAKALEPLAKTLQTLQAEKQMQSHKATLLERFKSKSIDEDFYAEALEGRTFNSDDDVEAFASRIETRWSAYSQKLAEEGLSRMSKPGGGGSIPKPSPSIEDVDKVIGNI